APRRADALALRRRQAGAVIVDHDPQGRARLHGVALGEHLHGDARLRPLAGIVDQIAYHLLEVLPLAAKARVARRLDVDRDAAIAMDLLHRTRSEVTTGATSVTVPTTVARAAMRARSR